MERGTLTALMCPGNGQDVGLRLSEYQATGIDAATYHDFSEDAYTENRYRAERRAMGDDIPVRTHYRPKS